MATLGFFTAAGTISTATDTAIVAAPGAGSRIYILWMDISVSVGGTTSRLRVENGVGGNVLARMATTAADAYLQMYYATSIANFPGRALSENTALNINTAGGAAATVDYEVFYEVKG